MSNFQTICQQNLSILRANQMHTSPCVPPPAWEWPHHVLGAPCATPVTTMPRAGAVGRLALG